MLRNPGVRRSRRPRMLRTCPISEQIPRPPPLEPPSWEHLKPYSEQTRRIGSFVPGDSEHNCPAELRMRRHLLQNPGDRPAYPRVLLQNPLVSEHARRV